MNKDDLITFGGIAFIMAVVAVMLIGVSFQGQRVGREAMQREAIMNGVAEWRPDENGNPQFHWKKP